jgi:hypothetical protein
MIRMQSSVVIEIDPQETRSASLPSESPKSARCCIWNP